MSYVQGFVIPVRTADKERYRDLAARMAPIFLEHGATRVVECWGDEVPRGTLTDFFAAVRAEPDETVVFAWAEYPDREAFEIAHRRVFADPRMRPEPDLPMPFDPKRMIFGCFTPIVDTAR